jgi:hypothetical protein
LSEHPRGADPTVIKRPTPGSRVPTRMEIARIALMSMIGTAGLVILWFEML